MDVQITRSAVYGRIRSADEMGAVMFTNPLEAAMDTLVMQLLEEHIPISLLLDLVSADGPASAEIFAQEFGDTSWVRRSA
jgi:hypothetical protein